MLLYIHTQLILNLLLMPLLGQLSISLKKEKYVIIFAEIYNLLFENYTLYVGNDASTLELERKYVLKLYLFVWMNIPKKKKSKQFMRVFTVFISQCSDSPVTETVEKTKVGMKMWEVFCDRLVETF